MSLFVECKPDETLVIALGVERNRVEHAAGSSGVCFQLAKHNGVTGMLDEDPGAPRPSYMRTLKEKNWEHEVRLLWDADRENRVIVISPRLEEWIVATAKDAKIKMTDFGFENDNGVGFHSEINQRLPRFRDLIAELVAKKSPRILRLQSLLLGKS